MRARARVAAECDDRGITRLAGMRSQAPLAVRATTEAVYLVGGAGGPLGGDDLTVEIDVGPGARLTVRTAAASIALPGGSPSWVRIEATVAAGGALSWLPEPTVAARRCSHHMEASVSLEEGARLVWREAVLLGRHLETPGSVVSRSVVDIDGGPLLRHELRLGPEHERSTGPAVTCGARAVGSVVIVDPAWRAARPPARVLGPMAAVMPLAGPGLHVLVLAPDAPALRSLLDAGSAVART